MSESVTIDTLCKALEMCPEAMGPSDDVIRTTAEARFCGILEASFGTLEFWKLTVYQDCLIDGCICDTYHDPVVLVRNPKTDSVEMDRRLTSLCSNIDYF